MKMKLVRIIALRQDRKRLLEHLQDYSLVQVKRSDRTVKGFEKIDTSSQTQVFERNVTLTIQALSILNKLSPEKKGMLAAFRGSDQIDPDEIGVIASKAGSVIDLCNRIVELNKSCVENAAEKVRLNTSLEQLTVWQNLDIPFNCGDTKSTAVFIGSVPKQYSDVELAQTLAKFDKDLMFDFEIQYSSADITCFVMVVPISQKQKAEEALRNISFARPMNADSSLLPKDEAKSIKDRLKEIEDETKKAKEEIISLSQKRKEIEYTQDYFRIRADKYRVINELDYTRHTFVLTGFIPEEDCQKLENLCNRVSTCYIEFEDADENEAPVKLKNSKFAKPAESIVNMYSPPSHSDIDPTSFLAFFYYFFFGMMFSDAGYGLLMIVAIAIVLKVCKPNPTMKNNLKLFQYCGVSTLIWGLVFGSIFGDAPAVMINHFTGSSLTMAQILPWPTLDPQKDALTLMIVSIAFGLVHILVGMGCKFYICFKNKDYKAAFFDTGLWMLLLVGIAVLATGMFTTEIVTYIGAAIAVLCAVGLVLTQGRDKKGFGKVVGGLASLYDITGYVSDLLSYSRLLALGLTTGVMAQVFNMLSTMFGTSPISIIPLAIIFLVGHAINIGLNALGSYVHTMRLQYVEMFSKFYEGGGKQFEPFSAKSKYIRIQEEKLK